MWVLVPTDEILFFARTKKSIQKKTARCRLLAALLAFSEGRQKRLPCPVEMKFKENKDVLYKMKRINRE
jgi:hypothetical protein